MSTSQLLLFATDIEVTVKAAMASAARESGLSREQITDRMNEIAGNRGVKLVGGNAKYLTKAILDKWLNPTVRTYFPPLRSLHIFCEATGSLEPLAVQAQAHGGMVINQEEAQLLRWAKAHVKLKEARKELPRIEGGLKK